MAGIEKDENPLVEGMDSTIEAFYDTNGIAVDDDTHLYVFTDHRQDTAPYRVHELKGNVDPTRAWEDYTDRDDVALATSYWADNLEEVARLTVKHSRVEHMGDDTDYLPILSVTALDGARLGPLRDAEQEALLKELEQALDTYPPV